MESPGSDDMLQFQDYSNTPSVSRPAPAEINVNSPDRGGFFNAGGRNRDPLSDLIYDMSTSVVGGHTGGDDGMDGAGSAVDRKVSFLTLEYYQQFFNVDTVMVLGRIVNSMVPKRAGSNYLRSVVGKAPDLYGPFWIMVTLIFSIAISGNIASYLHEASNSYQWRYNFQLVSYAATCIFLYANVIPAILWTLFRYSLKPVVVEQETESAGYTPSLLSLMCVYGYSLSIYIPVSVLWVIPISMLQWVLVITAALLSGIVLILVLTPALRNSKLSLLIIIGILSAHFLLAAGFMLYFFHAPASDPPPTVGPTFEARLTAEDVQSAQLKLVKHDTLTNLTGNVIR